MNVLDLIKDYISVKRLAEYESNLSCFMKEAVEIYNTNLVGGINCKPWVFLLRFDTKTKKFVKQIDRDRNMNSEVEVASLKGDIIATMVGGTHPMYTVAVCISYPGGMITLSKKEQEMLRLGMLDDEINEKKMKYVVVHTMQSLFGTSDHFVYELKGDAAVVRDEDGNMHGKLGSNIALEYIDDHGEDNESESGEFDGLFAIARDHAKELYELRPDLYEEFIPELKNYLR